MFTSTDIVKLVGYVRHQECYSNIKEHLMLSINIILIAVYIVQSGENSHFICDTSKGYQFLVPTIQTYFLGGMRNLNL